MRTGCDRANRTKRGKDGAPGWRGGVSLRRQFMLRVGECASWTALAERRDNLVRPGFAPRCERHFFASAVQLTTSVMAAVGCSPAYSIINRWPSAVTSKTDPPDRYGRVSKSARTVPISKLEPLALTSAAITLLSVER